MDQKRRAGARIKEATNAWLAWGHTRPWNARAKPDPQRGRGLGRVHPLPLQKLETLNLKARGRAHLLPLLHLLRDQGLQSSARAQQSKVPQSLLWSRRSLKKERTTQRTRTKGLPSRGAARNHQRPSQRHRLPKPSDPKFGNVIDIGDKFKRYGFWQAREGPLQDNPKALILFAGRSRPGDLSHCLARLGWVVCSVDTKSPKPTDVLEGTVWEVISSDIKAGYFDAVWMATPCGTFSPLRENPARA